jgi:rubrerythrin
MESVMESIHLSAITTAITIENKSLSFYNALSSRVTDNNTKRIFKLMAQEELEHLKSFYDLYPGSEDELINLLFKSNMYSDPYYCSLLKSVEIDANEKYALEISLKEEQACIEKYSVFVDTIREPHVREVFSRILNETINHSELISEEYMRLMNMVDKSDQDCFVRE